MFCQTICVYIIKDIYKVVVYLKKLRTVSFVEPFKAQGLSRRTYVARFAPALILGYDFRNLQTHHPQDWQIMVYYASNEYNCRPRWRELVETLYSIKDLIHIFSFCSFSPLRKESPIGLDSPKETAPSQF